MEVEVSNTDYMYYSLKTFSDMGNIMAGMPLSTLCPLAAVFASGILSGGALAISFLDARTFVTLAEKKEAGLIKETFPVWWPFGKSFMVPFSHVLTLSCLSAYWFTGQTLWLVTMAMGISLAPYTHLLMMKSIKALMGGDLTGAKQCDLDDESVYSATKEFCMLHHGRSIVLLMAHLMSLYSFSQH